MSVYIIAGYGVPTTAKDELKYRLYFSGILEYIKKHSSLDTNTAVIFCGGNTDLQSPYRRTEAAEMKRRFFEQAEQEGVVLGNGTIILEDRSLSTLENILYSYNIAREHDLLNYAITIFCEASRAERVQTFVHAIFRDASSVNVYGIDFYAKMMGTEHVDRKYGNEKVATEVGLWALENDVNLKKLRGFFEAKFEFIRNFQGEREEALKQWLQFEAAKTLEQLHIPFELS